MRSSHSTCKSGLPVLLRVSPQNGAPSTTSKGGSWKTAHHLTLAATKLFLVGKLVFCCHHRASSGICQQSLLIGNMQIVPPDFFSVQIKGLNYYCCVYAIYCVITYVCVWSLLKKRKCTQKEIGRTDSSFLPLWFRPANCPTFCRTAPHFEISRTKMWDSPTFWKL